jgi:hypothetical protein
MASHAEPGIGAYQGKSLAKRVSSHVAYALVVYTLLLIFEVSPQMESDGVAIWPYFLLVALVGMAIIPCRNLERRWQILETEGKTGNFGVEVALLWFAAIGIPTALMLLIKLIP